MSYELQAAYQISQLTFDYNPHLKLIEAVTESGRFCVVSQSIAYCPITDATLPNRVTHMIKDQYGKPVAYATEDEAMAEVGRLYEVDDDYGEVDYAAVGPRGYVRKPPDATSPQAQDPFSDMS